MTSSPNASRPWLAGALSIAAGTVAIVAGLAVFSSGETPVTTSPARHSVETSRTPRARRQAVKRQQHMAPTISQAPAVDSTPPSDLQHTPRPADATTGGNHASQHGGGAGSAHAPRPRPSAP